ncbi:twin-arginine translocation signal domain-containing protein [Sulfuricystis thermophila]|uniref:twin-arginine translocation signal domain-containing protein n=1 Tax=Sulfuricystis thermophila TaxID=2496847 RepID=UPI001035FB4C|nr:twin-arginine translocation signal domain-containing protein [Sulfuricystis thermophila]
MITRRKFLAATAVALSSLAAGNVLAAPPTVEIIAMPHPPVKMALGELRAWLAAQGNKLRVNEFDSESTEGMQRIQAVGLSGHIPILILIDGQYRFPRKEGGKVALINFPNLPNTPPGARGDWTTADVQAILAERIR